MRDRTVIKQWEYDENGHHVLCSITEMSSPPLKWNCGYCYFPFHLDEDAVKNIKVYGGVTFSEREDSQTIIGFDTNHTTGMDNTRTLDWLTEQTESMASQGIRHLLALNP